MEYIFRVKFQKQIKFVTLDESELNWRTFVDKGLAIFGVKIFEKSTVYLTDNVGTEIPQNLFTNIIKNFWNGSCFYVEITYIREQNSNEGWITPEQIETYFKSKNLEYFLQKVKEAEKKIIDGANKEHNGNEMFGSIDVQHSTSLSNEMRQKVIQHLVDFIVESFGLRPSSFQKKLTAKAAIMLFPSLEFKRSKIGGIDLLVNGDGGWINSRLKYLRQQRHKPKLNIQNGAMDNGAIDNGAVDNHDSIQSEVTDEVVAAEVILLKSLVVSDENMSTFIEKLNLTRKYRQKMLLDKEIHLKEQFPYFFSHPHLILKEFELANDNINSSAFIEKWTIVKHQLRNILVNHYNVLSFKTEWPEELEEILVLLKLFPSRQIGRNVIASNLTFKNSVLQLIHHEPLNAAPLPSKKGYPHIVACGDSQGKIEYCYLQLENLVFTVPEEFDFVQTFDLYFKLHKVFNQSFEPNLVNMMTFVQHAIYCMPEKGINVTTRMKEVANMLN